MNQDESALAKLPELSDALLPGMNQDEITLADFLFQLARQPEAYPNEHRNFAAAILCLRLEAARLDGALEALGKAWQTSAPPAP